MKIAVVHNTSCEGVINRFGQVCPEKYQPKTIQAVIDALCSAGHEVASLEADKTLLAALEQFMPPDREARPTGLAFNMAYGIQGECRYTHVPGMLEMAGVPYTGSGPLGHALALDKVITKIMMLAAGVPTPAYCVMRTGRELRGRLRFPLIVKPRHESTSYGLSQVHNAEELAAAVTRVVKEFQQDALVEEYIDGREVTIGLLGNENVEFLPPAELDFGSREVRMNTCDDKAHRRQDEVRRICPAGLGTDELAELQRIALATYHVCHLRDYARVDIRIDPQGRPFVLEVNSMAALGEGGSFVAAAKVAGYTYASLVNQIVDLATQRCFGPPIAPREAFQATKPLESAAQRSAALRPSQDFSWHRA